jgi:ketosteroid isomerase-like protein
MSEKDLDTIRSSYVALNGGDVQRALAALHRDAVWSESRELPGTDEFIGREAIEDFLVGFLEQWDIFEQHVESTVSKGERVLVNIHMNAIGSGSGAEVSARYAHVWTLRDGLGARVDAYYDSEAALRDFEA